MTNSHIIKQFKENLRGDLIESNHPDYDTIRQLYNGMIDKKPKLIARCVDVADVITSVNFARENQLLTAIRGGGHNGGGFASCDDGLMIDLSLLKGIHINPKTRHVRVSAGHTQGDMDHASHAFGLAVPAGIVSTTGVSGLTLGGGHGYLSREYGLTIDNLEEADLVLADGSFVTANEKENSDLFWAIRGGGGNFGVATSFLFDAHPVKTIIGGPMFWDIKDARSVMEWYRQYLTQAPEKMYVFLGLKKVPAADPFPKDIQGKPICALFWCYDGEETQAKELMAPARDLPRPIFEHVGPMPFTAMQSLFDALLPPGLQWYWKGAFVKELSDAAIYLHLEFQEKMPNDFSIVHLYPIDGAVHRVASEDTAWNFRDTTWSMVIAGIDPEPSNAEKIKTWARDYWEAMKPYCVDAGYVNFMMEEGQERVQATYGNNYERLREIKSKFDPHNLFRVNQNILPK